MIELKKENYFWGKPPNESKSFANLTEIFSIREDYLPEDDDAYIGYMDKEVMKKINESVKNIL